MTNVIQLCERVCYNLCLCLRPLKVLVDKGQAATWLYSFFRHFWIIDSLDCRFGVIADISRSATRSSDRMDWATPWRAWEYPGSQVKLVPWLQSEWINSASNQLVDGSAQPSQGMSVRVNGSLIFVCNGKWVDVLWTQIGSLGQP